MLLETFIAEGSSEGEGEGMNLGYSWKIVELLEFRVTANTCTCG